MRRSLSKLERQIDQYCKCIFDDIRMGCQHIIGVGIAADLACCSMKTRNNDFWQMN